MKIGYKNGSKIINLDNFDILDMEYINYTGNSCNYNIVALKVPPDLITSSHLMSMNLRKGSYTIASFEDEKMMKETYERIKSSWLNDEKYIILE